MTSRISMYRPALAGLLVPMSASAVAAQVNVTGALTGHEIFTVQAESCKPPEAEPVLPPKSGNSATSSRQP